MTSDDYTETLRITGPNIVTWPAVPDGFLSQRASDVNLRFFSLMLAWTNCEQTLELSVILEAMTLVNQIMA